MPVKVTPILKATLVDCIAACTIGACFFWLLLLQHLCLPPPPTQVLGIQAPFLVLVMMMMMSAL